ncbi:SusD/RagB family nutrient-binding outer membrane lipoprotein [Algoriphagus halophytocola]|uniref:SusD/RagB family nutrient-binding outer membrane lipoprotein n=1 Tax=Algoriphagus halophytocola TaxID=2991499 RepID=A0ABY6MM34_9BACT|nr:MULTISPECIES: SusD/RagB family nutrient-binding outer membrane lipoprotein [unclassified Algoriphagus]UZD24205.1 SusD/RagB family nutrient-binding outer membrane lipoprotein [Algoriphagus sp. TR-M5]WBL41574.1 SusD/RagB family nutrient-binding outer membrane lipoprotein [Algoriphagus sp. TR-M9]
MKRIYQYTTAILLLTFGTMTSCTKDFEEINTDPNNPVSISPSLLLPNAIQTVVDRYWGHSTRYQRLNIDAAMCWIQHLSRNIYINAEGDSYEIPLTISSGTWNSIYNESLINFERVKTLSAPGSSFENANYQGIAMTMQSFAFAYLTDVFGPIPYTEALQGTGEEPINSPKYDSQEEIYAGILNELMEANDLLSTDGPTVEGDILFNGDIMKWKRFANSLTLRIANRQASQKPAESRAIMAQILGDPSKYPVFENVEQAAELHHFDVIGSRNKMFDVFSTRSDWNISSTLIDKLLELDDERITVYAQPLEDGSYAGLPNGLTDAAAGTYNASRIGLKYLDPTAPSVLMTYAELEFIKAEAALDGDIEGDAAEYLESAIKASFRQQGLIMPDDYMSRIGGVTKESIMTQKWIALFGQGVEAWNEYRRTGYPVMPPPNPNAVFSNEGVLPTRIEYPSSEYSLNKTNLDEGISKLGGSDNMRTPLWWVE